MLIYKCDISDIESSEMRIWFDAMSSERRSEVIRIKNSNKQALKIAADHICRSAISDFCGIMPDKIQFGKERFGKPYAENLPVQFSVSHSGSIAICAVSEKAIGIDIEKIRPINSDIAQRFATEKELDYINANQNGFFEIWTLKEAYFKYKGTGIGADIKDVSFEIKANKIYCSDKSCKLSFYNAEKGYICTLCHNKSN